MVTRPESSNGDSASGQITLSEQYVQDCFHSYLKSSLTQAKAERLLDVDTLASVEGDLMITGPALCLYFAALRSTTNPPSVPLPRLSKSQSTPMELSLDNCPPSFRPFLIVWANTVPDIQSLPPEHQHDLARIICGLSPLCNSPNRRLNGIAADLRAVAIEISMRRTFQDRYASDLQAALDAGTPGDSHLRVKASFIPPPSYDAPSTNSSHNHSLRPPTPPPKSPRTPPSPSLLSPESPAIEFIRETLYAALANVLERTPSLRQLLRRDPGRAYFAAVAFAILDVASSSLIQHEEHSDEPVIRGVLGRRLTLSECPPELRPFMQELCDIGVKMRAMEEEDSVATVEALQHDKEPPKPRLDRVRMILEGGVGHVYNRDPEQPRDRTTSNRAVAFANRINALALAMTKIRAFRERQDAVFKVLTGVMQR
ncbi:hypothetical protein K474DRAFT_1588783 [Panus rudis PR-1116 ss-1]|nr:hypothetical protein K474DRAFT_1588783 [Panus rudis PR-1116 ss-1]